MEREKRSGRTVRELKFVHLEHNEHRINRTWFQVERGLHPGCIAIGGYRTLVPRAVVSVPPESG